MSRLTLAAFILVALISAPAFAQIKYVYAVDYPLGQKEAYIEWVRSVAPILKAPEEPTRIASYDNYFGSSPHRLIEFEFADMASAARYYSRPEIMAVLDELPNRGDNVGVHVLKKRGDYAKEGATGRTIKHVHTLDYPLAQKTAYLDWVRTVSSDLQTPEEVNYIAAFDSYFGSSPNRLIEFEFTDLESSARYFDRPEVYRVLESVVDHGLSQNVMIFKLRDDYSR